MGKARREVRFRRRVFLALGRLMRREVLVKPWLTLDKGTGRDRFLPDVFFEAQYKYRSPKRLDQNIALLERCIFW
jgi:hypothetical protein